jgi:hypothetical protein
MSVYGLKCKLDLNHVPDIAFAYEIEKKESLKNVQNDIIENVTGSV